ncbi:MAG: type I glyceraldehyde-3-phosphate dehydrogenase [Candidatus Yonathbacteria bacterium]|nr:type I glyceraldehyde-3-phosphate dehydrogenase [Candidatus Yonathbacteria bacterium]NTW47472.1 type I glyceraldehyde-3-phosphate dehydrogenase [Candidatus Yonathbacteria bacterium]
MSTTIAINGFGRIGRAFFKLAFAHPEINIVAVNDLGDVDNLAYLLKYDTAYGRSGFEATVIDGGLLVVHDGIEKEIRLFSEKDPSMLPWRDLDIDIVIESTGVFDSYEKSKMHLEAGAKRVVISAPVKDNPADAGIEGGTMLMGINHEDLATARISSNGSCTTNAAAPLIQILHESIGVEKALLSTVHAYTATQGIVDGPARKDFRRGRAAAQNIVPASTGAAIATTQVITDLEGKFDGVAMRVPVIVGSIVDITFIASRSTSAEEVNDILRVAAASDRWENIFGVTEEEIVSSDIIGNPYPSLADLSFTRVVDGNLVKVLAWYDNEAGYTNALLLHVLESGKYIG